MAKFRATVKVTAFKEKEVDFCASLEDAQKILTDETMKELDKLGYFEIKAKRPKIFYK